MKKTETKKTILVTGGCGYIGSHVVCLLSEAGYDVVVLDDLSTGFRKALLYQEKLYVGSCGDAQLLARVFTENDIEAVMHFAASIVVPESVTNPLKYYQNNIVNTTTLCQAVEKFEVKHFILSSTAAVYGNRGSDATPCAENFSPQPMNAYGRTKLVDEWILADLHVAHPSFRYVALRYFNVAGADVQGRIGQNSLNATHLIKRAVQVALGLYPSMSIFGDDYDTPDGTCIRDYIHIADLAAAHLKALEYLVAGGSPQVLNCGYSKGASVKEVLDTLDGLLAVPLLRKTMPRREGDAPCLIANATKIRETLGWKPCHDSLETILASALRWEMKLTNKKAIRRQPNQEQVL